MSSVKLIPLAVGRIEAAQSVITGGEGTITLPIISWLIEHRDGLALFDNGMHIGLQTDTTRLGRTAEFFQPDFEPGQEVSARLDQREIRPSDVDIMIFSHLHFDHAGGTAEIPDARILIQQAEWEAGHDAKLIERGVYDPVDYDHGHDVQLIDAEHDVFGDGLVTCIPTPGHTPGHQALRVELASGPVVLTGDCVYFEQMLDDMAVPKLGYDTDLQLQSMRHLAGLRDQGCRLLYGHDEAQISTLPADGLT